MPGFFILSKLPNLQRKMMVYILFNGAGQAKFAFSSRDSANAKITELYEKWKKSKRQRTPYYYIQEFELLN